MEDRSQRVKVALIGSGTSKSRTPAMHMAEGKAQGIEYSYVRFDTLETPYSGLSLAELLDMAEREGYAGLNITHPFKMEVPGLLHELSPEAKILGAVNTVVFSDGRRKGYNTDFSGFQAAFQKEMADVKKTHVLLLGAGGAGTAVALGLIESGVATLSVFDRSASQASALADRISDVRSGTRINVPGSLSAIDLADIDGVVNATPMGMDKYPGVAINVEDLFPTTWVADVVYFPLETELLRRAKDHGCRVMNGSGMAINQAVDAFRLFTGLEPDPERFSQNFYNLFQ